jgi:mitogen-activated protein kinase 15
MSEEIEPHVLEKYQVLQKLGRGAYGIVWKARNLKTGQLVALKKVYDAFQNSTDAQRTYREVMYLQYLNGHDNIIQLFSIHQAYNNRDLYLVFDLMETDLHVVIRAKILKPVHKQFIMYQLFKALKYIHSADLLHRDLKPSNMLINSDCTMKLADFGLARSIAVRDDGPAIVSDYIATRWYRAPEILLSSQSYSKAVDIWSAGCIMAELLLEQVLFDGKSSLNQMELIIELLGRPTERDIKAMKISQLDKILPTLKTKKVKSFTQMFRHLPPEATDLLRGMLNYNPSKRLSVEEILKHPYFEKLHNPAEEISCDHIFELPLNDNERKSVKIYREAIYEAMRSQGKEAKPTESVHKRDPKLVSSGYKSPEVKQSTKMISQSIDQLQERKVQSMIRVRSGQKVLNKENMLTKKTSKESLGLLPETKSMAQSFMSRKKSSLEIVPSNPGPSKYPSGLIEKTNLANQKLEKVMSNSMIKPRTNKSFVDANNIMASGHGKKLSEGIVSSNMLLQKYQNSIKNSVSNSALVKLNPHFLFKSRPK